MRSTRINKDSLQFKLDYFDNTGEIILHMESELKRLFLYL